MEPSIPLLVARGIREGTGDIAGCPQIGAYDERMTAAARHVILRLTTRRQAMETIVVGVDGSEGGNAALEFAAQEAVAHNARLRVVCSWELPYAAYTGGFVPPVDMRDTVSQAAEETARAAAEIASRLQPSIYVEHEAVEGHPAETLARESHDAHLVVVGSRGHGGFASMLLGSVSHEVAQHAHCPVAIVPRARSREARRRSSAAATSAV